MLHAYAALLIHSIHPKVKMGGVKMTDFQPTKHYHC